MKTYSKKFDFNILVSLLLVMLHIKSWKNIQINSSGVVSLCHTQGNTYYFNDQNKEEFLLSEDFSNFKLKKLTKSKISEFKNKRFVDIGKCSSLFGESNERIESKKRRKSRLGYGYKYKKIQDIIPEKIQPWHDFKSILEEFGDYDWLTNISKKIKRKLKYIWKIFSEFTFLDDMSYYIKRKDRRYFLRFQDLFRTRNFELFCKTFKKQFNSIEDFVAFLTRIFEKKSIERAFIQILKNGYVKKKIMNVLLSKHKRKFRKAFVSISDSFSAKWIWSLISKKCLKILRKKLILNKKKKTVLLKYNLAIPRDYGVFSNKNNRSAFKSRNINTIDSNQSIEDKSRQSIGDEIELNQIKNRIENNRRERYNLLKRIKQQQFNMRKEIEKNRRHIRCINHFKNRRIDRY